MRGSRYIRRYPAHHNPGGTGGRARRWPVPARVSRPAVVALLVFASVAPLHANYGYTSPPIGNPVGPGTVPPSSYESGLVNTPNPLNSGNNAVITGNVRGLKQFRGPIPYDATTSFRAPLGSTSLDSFLRETAIPDGRGEYAPGYSTFYSPTGTVTTTQPGYSGVFTPISPRIIGGVEPYRAEQPADVMALTDIPPSYVPPGQAPTRPDAGLGLSQGLRLWPMSRTPNEMQEIISEELGDQLTERRLSQQGDRFVTPEEYERQLEQLRRDIDRIQSEASRLEQAPRTDYEITQPLQESLQEPLQQPLQQRLGEPLPEPARQLPGSTSSDAGLPQPPQSMSPPVPPYPGSTPERNPGAVPGIAPPPGEGLDPGAATDGLTRPAPLSESGGFPAEPSAQMSRIDAIFAPRLPGTTAQTDYPARRDLPALERVRETSRAFDTASKYLGEPSRAAAQSTPATPNPIPSPTNHPDTASGGSTAAGNVDTKAPDEAPPEGSGQLIGDRFRRKYENAGAFSQERFERYLRAGELYLQQGRYYRASDAFTLAAMYKPQEAQPYLRKSHALLAAGEYTSSAISLARAIELDPQRTLAGSDLVDAVGSPDLFVQRVGDLEQSAETSSSPQFQFLLAYIYYQMDRPREARTAIEAVVKELPNSPAAGLLKDAIGG